MAQIDLKQATLTIMDGDTPVNELEVRIGEGNLTYNETRNMEYKLNRGLLDEVREGDEVPVAVTFDFVWDYIKGSTLVSGAVPTIEDTLKKRGNAVDWVSSDADACRPYAVDLVIVYTPDCSTGEVETITLADFRWEALNHDLSAGTIAVTGNCNVTEATSARTANV